jgi:hypothetical protein
MPEAMFFALSEVVVGPSPDKEFLTRTPEMELYVILKRIITQTWFFGR